MAGLALTGPAVHHPERGPAVRQVLAELQVLDATSPDVVI